MCPDQVARIHTGSGRPAHVQLKLHKGRIGELQQQVVEGMLRIIRSPAELRSMVMNNTGQTEFPQMLTHPGHLLCAALAVIHSHQMIQRAYIRELCAEFLSKSAILVIPQAAEGNDTNAQVVDEFMEVSLAQPTCIGAHGLNAIKPDTCQALDCIQDALLGGLQNRIYL